MAVTETTRGSAARAAAVAFAGLAAAAAGAAAWAPQPPRWLALAAVACLAAAFACAGAERRLRAIARHPFRVLRDTCTLAFRLDDEAAAKGASGARGKVRIETLYRSLCDGQDRVRLQKFVTEPTHADADALLRSWAYGCRVVGLSAGAAGDAARSGGHGTGDHGAGDQEAGVEAAVSDSRALWMEVALPRPVARGETFTLVETLEVAGDLDDAGGAFMFQVAYPTERREVEVLFEGLRPEGAEYRIGRGEAVLEAGPLEVAEAGPGRWRIVRAWRRPETGSELALRWAWDPRSLAARASSTERLIAEARARQAELEARLATRFEIADEGGEAAAADPPGTRASADDHPIIKAARARERTLSGGAPAASRPPAAPQPLAISESGPMPEDIVPEDLIAKAGAPQTSIHNLLAAQARAEADAKAESGAGPGTDPGTGSRAAGKRRDEPASAEDHPIIRAARERERLLYGRTSTAATPRPAKGSGKETPGADKPDQGAEAARPPGRSHTPRD